ncbi:MAG: glycosyltransferase family 9 protein [Verrucomicrobiales bacterium]|nr:glycosyltransferase family 9 protein [Verrucomicrobiales bacterium]
MTTEPAKQERVLVIKPSSFGDVIHTLPAVAALKKAHPHWDIQWLVNEEWVPLLEGHPDLEEVIPFPRRDFRGLGALLQARKWAVENLAPRHFDRVIDLQGLLRSALLAKACGAKHVCGFRQAREGASFFYDEKINLPDWKKLHAIQRYMRLAQSQGALDDDEQPLSFWLPAGEKVQGMVREDGRPLVILHPFSRGLGKSLTEQEVSEFCQSLQQHHAEVQIALLGSDSWQGQTLPANTLDLMGKTNLPQLIWCLRQADTVVSVDSGPMHLAAAISDRLISIHTWTDPAVVGPFQKGAWIWRDGLLIQVAQLEAGQLPEQRKRKKLIEELRQRTGRLLPEGSMAKLAQAASPEGVFAK